MFKYVSAANLFGEILGDQILYSNMFDVYYLDEMCIYVNSYLYIYIIEWSGYAVAAGSLPCAAFAIFTASNIAPRGLHHHKWYIEKFKEGYPQDRKAIIPFVL